VPKQQDDEQPVKPVGLPGAQAGFGSLKPVIDQSFQDMVSKGAPPVQAPPIRPNPQPIDPDLLTKLMIILKGRQYGQPPQATLGTR
jgi:hypothetical protein